MKTSSYSDDEPQFVECTEGLVSPEDVEVTLVTAHRAELVEADDGAARDSSQFVSAEDLSVQRMETQRQKWRDSQASLASSEVSVQREPQPEERWSDTQMSPPSWEASAAAPLACEPTSDMYYTASSEVSLVSETDVPPPVGGRSEAECVLLGHVAAMRERFESMTRANTPCPDAARAPSPSFDVFRNITPSPDLLG